jgi:methyl-accepting chemotaxis protein
MEEHLTRELTGKLVEKLYHATTTQSIDAILETAIQNHDDIECLYVINGEGRQLSHTIMNPRIIIEKDENFKPALPGEDYSSKKYFRQAIKNKQELYTSQEYISKATGNLCKTISYAYQCDDKEYYVICIDLLCRF